MPFRRVRKLVALAAAGLKSLTVDAIKTAALFLFEPTFKVRGHVHVSCDAVRVDVHPAGSPNKEEGSMSNDDLNLLATDKGVPGKMRGARPTPRFKLAGAVPFTPTAVPPAQAAWVPPVLHVFGNDRFGDCVSAEEGFAKLCGSPPVDVGDQVVIQWAQRHGVLNGADLADVLDMMASDGYKVDASMYDDGGKLAVDFSNEAILQAAIATGPVKIAIDADALPPGAGNAQGWYAIGRGRYPNTDHCVSLCGYGPAGYLFEQLHVPLPSRLQPTQAGYLLFTWGTIGFVDHAWLMGTCTEAWVRNPTTVVVGPKPPPPPPPPPPVPVPIPASVATLIVGQELPAGTYYIQPGASLKMGTQQAAPWALILQIIIAILNGLVPVVPPMPPPPVPPTATLVPASQYAE